MKEVCDGCGHYEEVHLYLNPISGGHILLCEECVKKGIERRRLKK